MGKADIGKRIRKFRLAAGLTQAELAAKIGTTPSAIGMYENNRREPTFDMLEEIAGKLGVHVNRLIVDENELLSRISAQAWERGKGDVNEAVAWQSVLDDFGVPSEDQDRLEALHQNPRLRLLFDRQRRMSEADVEAMLAIADRIVKEDNEN